jgi:hypothetical protein
MSRLLPLTLTALSLIAAACSESRCPKRYVQRGTVCKVCPTGSAPSDNECVTIDGGVVVDPVEADGGVVDDDDEPRSDAASSTRSDGSTSGADARTSSPERDTSVADAATSPDAGPDNSNTDAGGELDASSSDAATSNDASSPVADASADAVVDAGPPCYADKDKDGVGAGPAVSCDGYGTDAGSSLSLLSTDCDDNNNKRSPSLTDVCGDNIDNDCDGTPDDESNNACGGPCTAQLAHQPGQKCDNGLLGACARDGSWVCQGTMATVCDAPSVSAGPEVCGDGVDNDCDERADEEDAINATVWYEDCDGDGYSALTDVLIAAGNGVRTGCAKPAPAGSCAGGWTARKPQAPQTGIPASAWDCDDYSAAYTPEAGFGLPPAGKSRTDLNCDGVNEKDPLAYRRFGDEWFLLHLCNVGESCLACNDRITVWGAGRWNSSGTKPRCSMSETDTLPFESVVDGLNLCNGNLYAPQSNGGLQKCR